MSEFVVTDGAVPQGYSTGLVPRNYETHPVGYNSKPFQLKLIPESEWQNHLDVQKASRAQLSNVRRRGKNGGIMPSTDQGSKGFCWAHSTTSAELLSRAFQNEPYADLSAYAVACVIKGYRDQGGWGAESLEFVAKNGIPTSEFWPQRSMSRDNDTPAMRANASKHKITEWMDLEPRNKAQLVTCLLLNIPVVIDLNWWGHSVCAMDIVSFNPFRIKIWNSWGDQWGDQGEGILEGNKAIPDGAIAPFVTMGG
jgi:C1A family cysteine protease